MISMKHLKSFRLFENVIEGGKADKLSVEDIAKKFNVPVEKIMDQISKGVKVESEHTDDVNAQIEIAMDHLTEMPDYYDRLNSMEDEYKIYNKK